MEKADGFDAAIPPLALALCVREDRGMFVAHSPKKISPYTLALNLL